MTTKSTTAKKAADAAPTTRRQAFIRQLAEYLVGNQVEDGMRLGMGDARAKQWATLRGQTPLFGYPTVAEAEAQLTQWFDRGMP